MATKSLALIAVVAHMSLKKQGCIKMLLFLQEQHWKPRLSICNFHLKSKGEFRFIVIVDNDNKKAKNNPFHKWQN